MRRVFKGIARGVLAVAVVFVLAAPAEARSRDDQRGRTDKPSIMQLVKQWVVRAFGDGLTCPRP